MCCKKIIIFHMCHDVKKVEKHHGSRCPGVPVWSPLYSRSSFLIHIPSLSPCPPPRVWLYFHRNLRRDYWNNCYSLTSICWISKWMCISDISAYLNMSSFGGVHLLVEGEFPSNSKIFPVRNHSFYSLIFIIKRKEKACNWTPLKYAVSQLGYPNLYQFITRN